jgi:hypothetical protein
VLDDDGFGLMCCKVLKFQLMIAPVLVMYWRRTCDIRAFLLCFIILLYALKDLDKTCDSVVIKVPFFPFLSWDVGGFGVFRRGLDDIKLCGLSHWSEDFSEVFTNIFSFSSCLGSLERYLCYFGCFDRCPQVFLRRTVPLGEFASSSFEWPCLQPYS